MLHCLGCSIWVIVISVLLTLSAMNLSHANSNLAYYEDTPLNILSQSKVY